MVRTSDQGYLLALEDARLDLVEFRAPVGQATSTAELTDRVVLLERALGWWRGEPLADVAAESLVEEVAPGLVEERLSAVETLVDARLRLGRYSATVAELSRLTAEHPLRERFWAQRVVALAGAGRRAEALRAYAEIRSRLRTELRIEPGNELQESHRHVLRQDLPVEAPRTDAVPLMLSAPGRQVVPEQLPADPAAFTGRDGPLAALDGALPDDGPTGSAVVISAIGGTDGVGKTAPAVHWARRVRKRFPDGQLYVDLRGYGPGAPPTRWPGSCDPSGISPSRSPGSATTPMPSTTSGPPWRSPAR